MKKLSSRLNRAGFECVLPKFSLGKFSSKEIEKVKTKRKREGLKKGELEKIVKVKKWFYKELRRCDVIIVFDKNGYLGVETSAEIGSAYILNKPVFFLEEPKDHGMKSFLKLSKKFKVVNAERLVDELMALKSKT